MTVKPSPQVSREADQLEALLDQLPLTGQQREKAWDTWADRGMAAALGVVRRYKEAGDPLDQAYQALRAAYDAGDAPGVQAALKQMINCCTQPATTKPIHTSTRTDASPTSVTKQTKVASLDAILAGGVAARARNGGL